MRIDGEQFLSMVVGLAGEHPGLAVAVMFDGEMYQLGILNLDVTDADWFRRPVRLRAVLVKSPLLYEKGDDPGEARTLNQRIKSP